MPVKIFTYYILIQKGKNADKWGMENRKNFVEELSVILETKRNEFNSQILPKVRENYNIQSSALHAVRSTLLKKRVIHDDPYK